MTESCAPFDALIARTAQLTEEESARLEAHLAGCGACRELARALAPVDDDVTFATKLSVSSEAGSAGPAIAPSSSAKRPRGSAGVGGRVAQRGDRSNRDATERQHFCPSPVLAIDVLALQPEFINGFCDPAGLEPATYALGTGRA